MVYVGEYAFESGQKRNLCGRLLGMVRIGVMQGRECRKYFNERMKEMAQSSRDNSQCTACLSQIKR